ncbi:acyl-CoA thioesterase [Aureisphaera galaxeae]|uniref:acyl-CoA thioesterase n=1 Tax=Aureisphaera galaxeae TaxID=1538023 RepID=UPI0023503163|nr:acyl-CoA thioesterase [Aureisphaera galaxeae]MDC8005331.1 acyl-CoA thioesterase [Aureisphaera galaxeae]
MYFKEFDIRWSDLDANRHLANSSYINFMSHTRMGFLIDHGINQEVMMKYDMGPVVFNENVFYFKEIFQGQPIRVSFQLGGMSEDGMFFRFVHNFYDHKGRNLAFCEMQGGWMDLKARKLTALPEELLPLLAKAPKTDDFKVLTKMDMRQSGRMPKDLA